MRVFNQHVKWAVIAPLECQPPLAIDAHMPGAPSSNCKRASPNVVLNISGTQRHFSAQTRHHFCGYFTELVAPRRVSDCLVFQCRPDGQMDIYSSNAKQGAVIPLCAGKTKMVAFIQQRSMREAAGPFLN